MKVREVLEAMDVMDKVGNSALCKVVFEDDIMDVDKYSLAVDPENWGELEVVDSETWLKGKWTDVFNMKDEYGIAEMIVLCVGRDGND